MIGSHNSWTYLKPKKLWMRLINFTAKCQSKDIAEQFANGARCFDLRVRFDDEYDVTLAHGLVKYKYSYRWLLNDLKWLDGCAGEGEKIYVRILHEVRKSSMYTQERVRLFRNFCADIEQICKNLVFFGGNNLVNWEQDYLFRDNVSIEDGYASMACPKLGWWPWLYAKLFNKKNLKRDTDKQVLMIDFV